MNCSVYIATSIDGFIADKQGGIDWLMEIENPDNDDFGFSDFINSVDALVMGRNTFEKVCSFDCPWPYSKPVYVLSSSLKSIPEELKEKVFLVDDSIDNLLEHLSEQGMQNLYIDGGSVIQSFLEKNLIDEMIITRIPVVLGEGIPLFKVMDMRLKFSHLKTEILLDEMVKSQYRRL